MEAKKIQSETLEVLKDEGEKTPSENLDELGYYISPFYNQLMKAKRKVIRGNLDRVWVIDGREGEAGKSTLAMQLGYALDPTMTLDQIVFTAKDFKKKIRELGKYKVLIWDEAFRGAASKSALSKENKKVMSLLQECRQRNLFIFIVLPSIFMLELYVAIFRSQALIHAFSKKNMRRYYKIYNYRNKKLLYLKGKKLMDYFKPKLSKRYTFYGKLPPSINRKEYDDKKSKAFRDEDEEKQEETKHLLQRNMAWWILTQKKKVSQVNLIDFYKKFGLGVSKSTMSHAIDTVPRKFEVRSSYI